MAPMKIAVRFMFFGLILILASGLNSCTSSNEPRVIVQTQTVQNRFPDIYEYDIPDTLTLCGETIDLKDQGIREMFDREFTIMVWDRPQVLMWIKRSGRYFPYFEKALSEKGLPDDLKYLAVAESSLHLTAKSHAGANGLWQIMESASKRFGLRVEKGVMDERLSVERSTDVALRYLKEHRNRLGSWMLALAAYNCGENLVNQAVKTQKTEDYFSLNLPLETERYVFRIAAIKMILEKPEKFGYRVDPERMYKPVRIRTVTVDISGRFYIADLCSLSGVSLKDFMELNPKILSSILPQGQYSLNLPPDYVDDFIEAIDKLSDPDFRVRNGYDKRYVVVREGDVLYTISWRTGVSVEKIMKLNNLKTATINPGQRLLIRE